MQCNTMRCYVMQHNEMLCNASKCNMRGNVKEREREEEEEGREKEQREMKRGGGGEEKREEEREREREHNTGVHMYVRTYV
eukprot:15332745-Ditylum_brightwellii.AAC.1